MEHYVAALSVVFAILALISLFLLVELSKYKEKYKDSLRVNKYLEEENKDYFKQIENLCDTNVTLQKDIEKWIDMYNEPKKITQSLELSRQRWIDVAFEMSKNPICKTHVFYDKMSDNIILGENIVTLGKLDEKE